MLPKVIFIDVSQDQYLTITVPDKAELVKPQEHYIVKTNILHT